MARALFESSALSAFFGSIAVMVSAGIQTDEAVLMIAENREDSHFKRVCDEVYQELVAGSPLHEAMAKTGAFPKFSIEMVRIGEASGRLEHVLRSLDQYYDEEDRLFEKMRASVGYPAALLCIMAIILAFTVAFILPVFVDVYQNMTGTLTSGSLGAVGFSVTIGWIALGITVVCAVAAVVLAVASRTERGRLWIFNLFEGIPSTKQAMYQLAVARFTMALSTYVSSGVSDEQALAGAMQAITHTELRRRLKAAHAMIVDVDNALSLSQALSKSNVYDAFYARMLTVGSHAGSTDEVLGRLATIYFDDAIAQIDRVVDRIEPLLAALLTIAVGITLVAVMLPLIGITGSIA